MAFARLAKNNIKIIFNSFHHNKIGYDTRENQLHAKVV
jgi:hypothetical protein